MSSPWTLSAVGLSPFGLGTPTSGAAPPTGTGSLSRFLDAGAGDYLIDDLTGQFASMPKLRQRFLLAIKTRQGSVTTDTEFGLRLPRTMGNGFEREVELSVRRACRHLTEVEKVARIDAVLVERTGSGRCRITIVFTDLTTGIPDDVTEEL